MSQCWEKGYDQSADPRHLRDSFWWKGCQWAESGDSDLFPLVPQCLWQLESSLDLQQQLPAGH